MSRLGIIVPCYNEEEVFKETTRQLTGLVKELIEKRKISEDSFILYVNDGSKDATWDLIENEYNNNKYICGLKLAGNVGHQNALLAGLLSVKDIVDVTISIDADLQDDISVMEEMLDKYREGAEIVYGVRNQRLTDTFFKRFTAQGFYKVMSLMGVKTVYNHADYRLMSSKAVNQLEQYKERNLFLRGIVPLIGYKTDCVYYARKERMAGTTKYPLKKMITFAIDGITSFSTKPLLLISVLGLAIVFVCILSMLYSLIRFFSGQTVWGWSSLFISIWFLGGVQLLSLGIIGQYVGKVYVEIKERPRYNIEEFLNKEKTASEREEE